MEPGETFASLGRNYRVGYYGQLPVRKLQDEVSCNKPRHRDLQSRLRDAKAERDEVRAQVWELQDQVSCNKPRHRDLKIRLRDAETERDQLRDQVRELQDQVSCNKSRHRDLKKQLRDAEAEKDLLQDQVWEWQERNQDLQEENNSLRVSNDSFLSLDDQLYESEQELRRDLQHEQMLRSAAEAEQGRLAAHCEVLETQLSDLKNENNELQTKSSRTSAEIIDTKIKLINSKARVESLKDYAAELRSEHTALRQELSEVRASASEEVRELQDEVDSLERDSILADEKYRQLVDKTTKEIDKSAAALKKHRAKSKDMELDLGQQIADLQHRNKNLVDKLGQTERSAIEEATVLRAAIKSLEDEKIVLDSNAKDEKEGLEKQIVDLQHKNKAQVEKLSQAESTRAEEAGALHSAIESLKDEKITVGNEYQRKFQESTNTIEELQSQVSALIEAHSHYSQTAANVNMQLQQHMTELEHINKLEEELAEAEVGLEASSFSVESFEQIMTALKQETLAPDEDGQKAQEALQEEIESQRSDLNDERRALMTLCSDIAQVSDVEISRLRQEVTELRGTNRKLEEQLVEAGICSEP